METADLKLADGCKNNLRTSTPNDKPFPPEFVTTPSNPACSRKRKVDRQDAIECCPTPLKRRFEARALLNELEAEAEGGRFLCWCSEWISLRNGTRVSLEVKGITSFEDIISNAMEELHSPEITNKSDIETDNESLLSLVSVDTPGISEKEKMKLSDREGNSVSRADDTHSVQDTIDEEDNRPKNTTEPRSPVQGLLKRRRPNRTEAERVQDFLDDPQVKELEPILFSIAFCVVRAINGLSFGTILVIVQYLGNAINLLGEDAIHSYSAQFLMDSMISKQNAKPRGSCNATPIAGTSKLAPSTQDETVSLDSLSPQSTVDSKVPPANMHPSLQIGSLTLEQPSTSKSTCDTRARRPRLTDAENRKAVLEADLNAETVEPHRVLCALCKKWVKLRPNSTYCSAPWQNHIRRCMAKLDKKAYDQPEVKISPGYNVSFSRLKAQSTGNVSEDESNLTTPANQTTPRRRGRPSKNHVAQKPDENNSESDRSYESEEE